MKRFLNSIARSIIAAADAIAKPTDDQSSLTPSPIRGSANDTGNEESSKDKDLLATDALAQSQQNCTLSGLPAYTSLLDLRRDDGFADQPQSTDRCDGILDEPELSPGEAWISFADANELSNSNITLDIDPTSDPSLNEVHTEDSPVRSTAELDIACDFFHSKPLSQVASASKTSVGSQYLGFDISLSDLEEKSESTWQDSQPIYGSTIQSQPESPGLPRYEESVEEIERAQASHKSDLDLANLEVSQQSTWQDSPREAPADKLTTSPTNIRRDDNQNRKPRIDSQLNSTAQQGSILELGIQGAVSLHETLDDYSSFRIIKLRPDGLEELQLRQSGILAWNLRWDPEDYIWALDGVGYFDNIWNVEGFFDSMVGEAEDRCYESLYWTEYQDY